MTQAAYSDVGMTCDHYARSVTEEDGAFDGVTDDQVDV